MKSRSRSSNFFSSVARSRRAFSAGVPAFLLAAAVALGVSAVPARAANVTVYDRDDNFVASGDSLDDVKSSIANDSTVVLSGDTTASGSLLQVPVSLYSFALTVKSATTGSLKTCENTADAYLFSDDRSGMTFFLEVRDVVFSGGAGIIRSTSDVTLDAANSTFSGNHAASSRRRDLFERERRVRAYPVVAARKSERLRNIHREHRGRHSERRLRGRKRRHQRQQKPVFVRRRHRRERRLRRLLLLGRHFQGQRG